MNDWGSNERNSTHSLRFLVVESSLGVRILIRAHLVELKHSVDMAWDDESAIELACMRAYDFILVDKTLNCFELINHIQKHSIVNEHTPVIILTSINNEDSTAKGSILTFKKPITKNDILQLIDFLNHL
ncbi:response regulator [Legionella pneumophila]|uniref:response regulator n=1 Tax=Legionella pneumophila TaxID=446 RepID=UPI0022B50345|nr:response regulator [Legionella pneumophila]MCZ4798202.1 response regulator [Legionella pneumophila]